MKVAAMNTPPKSVELTAAQLEIPFAQPVSQSIQPKTQSTIQAPQPNPPASPKINLQEGDLALVEPVAKEAPEMSRQKAKKKKADRVKAAFNLMDYIVKYYNTGETYVSRAFTLVGMVSLLMLGANRLTTLEGGLANLVPPLDVFPTLLNNLQDSLPGVMSNVSADASRASKPTPMTSSFDQVTRLQPALVSPSFTSANPIPSEVTPIPENAAADESAPAIESAPAPVSSPKTSAPAVVENTPWVNPTSAPQIPSVSLPLPEINAPLPPTVQETITEVQQEVQQAAGQLNQSLPIPDIVSPQPADLGAKVPQVLDLQQGVQQVTEQLGQVASPSIPIEADALPSVPTIPSAPEIPAGIRGIF